MLAYHDRTRRLCGRGAQESSRKSPKASGIRLSSLASTAWSLSGAIISLQVVSCSLSFQGTRGHCTQTSCTCFDVDGSTMSRCQGFVFDTGTNTCRLGAIAYPSGEIWAMLSVATQHRSDAQHLHQVGYLHVGCAPTRTLLSHIKKLLEGKVFRETAPAKHTHTQPYRQALLDQTHPGVEGTAPLAGILQKVIWLTVPDTLRANMGFINSCKTCSHFEDKQGICQFDMSCSLALRAISWENARNCKCIAQSVMRLRL